MHPSWASLGVYESSSTNGRRWPCFRGMNMLYESMRDKGSMVIVPSSAIESMGLGGTLATVATAKQR